jgi:hypothetical protein
MSFTHRSIADYSRCPRCWAAQDPAAPGYASLYFNGSGALWAVCEGHAVRWYVTRELLCSDIPSVLDAPGSPFELQEVAGVYGRC